MLRKNIILSALFIFCINYIFGIQEQAQTLKQWLSSFFTTPTAEKSAFSAAFSKKIAKGKPLDLANIYKKEPTINDAIASAKLFKGSVKNFLFGASSSSYQYEGGLDSNNAAAIFYQNKGLEPAGHAIDFWNNYSDDISQIKQELGINCFRLSIAWDRVQLAPEIWNQPNQIIWDEKAIQRYVDIIKTLKNNKIEPIVVLHHYTIPQWFAEIGGFEKYENKKYFIEFAKKMYDALHEHVIYWSTFNAIEGYAFKGYYTLDGPPGKQKSLSKTQTVMYNMLAAHAGSYQAIKNMHADYSKQKKDIHIPQIGIQKNIVLLDPADKRFSTSFITTFGTALQNKMIFSLLYYRYYNSLDWIGVNIYSNMLMIGSTRQQEEEEERKTENLNYRDYPEGIYRAVKIINDNIAKPLNIRIIITENGIATKNDNQGHEKRRRFFQRSLYTIRNLIEEGYPIIGYTPWASHDNYEWPSEKQPNPYDRPYGFFHVEFDKDSPNYLKRTLKDGAHFYRDFITEYFKSLSLN